MKLYGFLVWVVQMLMVGILLGIAVLVILAGMLYAVEAQLFILRALP